MILVNSDTLLGKIVPMIPGCNDTIAKIALADAARTFARETDIVIETKSYSTPDAPEYGRMPEIAEDSDNFIPLHFIARKEDTKNKRVYVTYSVLPKNGMLPESVLNRHYEAVVDLALSILYNMPAKPWSSPQLSNYYMQKYSVTKGDALRDNITGGAVFDQSFVCLDPGDFSVPAGMTVNTTVIGTDTTGGTITADSVLNGYIGFSNGEKIIGGIQTVVPVQNKNTFSVSKGFVASPVQYTIPESTPYINENTVTVPAGYIMQEQKLTVPEAEINDDGKKITVSAGYVAQGFTVTYSAEEILNEIKTELEGI